MIHNGTCQILIAHHSEVRRDELRHMLEALGHDVVASVGTRGEVIERAVADKVDVIVSSLRLTDGDGIEALIEASREQPIPSVIVTPRSDLATIERALDDHVMAYLVEPITIDDLRPTIVLVQSRFAQFLELRQEVDDLKGALEARKTIEKAKGVLMKQKQLDETAAYRLLQKLASEKRRKLVEVAEAILLTADL